MIRCECFRGAAESSVGEGVPLVGCIWLASPLAPNHELLVHTSEGAPADVDASANPTGYLPGEGDTPGPGLISSSLKMLASDTSSADCDSLQSNPFLAPIRNSRLRAIFARVQQDHMTN